jgi:hypothetical protein
MVSIIALRIIQLRAAIAVGCDAIGIERLAGTEQLASIARRQHAGRRAAGAVQHQHRNSCGLAHGGVVQPDLRHHLAGMEFEILGDPFALFRSRIVGRERRTRDQGEGGRQGSAH